MKKLFYPICIALLAGSLFSCSKSDVLDEEKKDEELGVEIAQEDLKTIVEIASFDTTFTFKGQEYMSATSNFKENAWSDEFAGIKISVAEQKDILDKAKKGNGNKDVKVYVSAVHGWPAATAQFSAIVYKGKQNDFKEITRGESINKVISGNNWTRLIMPLKYVVEIKGDEDLFVGYIAMNAAANTYPVTIMSKNPNFKGRDAKYPSYGLCPDIETVMQEVNDPADDRWNSWVDNSNWCVKVVISKEIVY